MTKDIKVNIFFQALLTGVGSVCVVLAGYPQYVYLMFAGFTVANCCDHKISKIPNLIASELAGWIWAILMFIVCNWITAKTGILPLGFFVAIFLGSLLLIGFHVRFTMGTWMNFIPIMYMVIFCWFSIMDYSRIPVMIGIITFGMILTTFYDPLTNLIVGKKEEKNA